MFGRQKAARNNCALLLWFVSSHTGKTLSWYRHWQMRFASALVLVCVAYSATAQEKIDFKRTPEQRLQITIVSVPNTWSSAEKPTIRVQIRNVTSEDFNSVIGASLRLTPSSMDASGVFSAPIDLARDSPAQTERTNLAKSTVAIRLVPQHLQIAKQTTAEFVLHPDNMEWGREMSSVWPHDSLFRSVEPRRYNVELVIGTDRGEAASNSITVTIQKVPDARNGLR